MRKIFCVLFLLVGVSLSAQNLAVKTNLLYDASSTINLGTEIGLSPKWTLDLSANYNGWTFSENKKWKHWLAQPEARYWLCERFNGHFVGAHLEYRRDSYAVLPEYRTNRAELDSVQRSFALLKDNPNLTVTAIYITGYASPEGSMAYNEKLSQRRAQTFADYVQKHNKDLPKDLWHVSWKGEDWDGFVAQVEQAEGWPARAKVQEAIAQCNDNIDACEWKIRQQLSADDYRYLIDELYAPLRRNDYRIEYTVRNFTPEEARQMLEVRPDLLSAAEMQRVADSYGRNTDAYRKALDTALRTYPDNVALRYNAALAAVEAGRYTEAITLLKDTQDGASLNLLGVAHYKSGDKCQAEQAFRRAVQAGYAPAEESAAKVKEALELLGK